MSKDEKIREMVTDLTETTILAIMVKHRNGTPKDAAKELAGFVLGIIDSANEEMDKIRSVGKVALSVAEAAAEKAKTLETELAEKNKVITGLIKSNDEYADSLTQKIAEIRSLRAGEEVEI